MSKTRKAIGALALFALAVLTVKRATPRPEVAVPELVPFVLEPEPAPAAPARHSWRRRAALTLAYTSLFFAGGAVVAGAGNELAQVDPESTTPVALAADAASTDPTDTTTTDETTTDQTTTDQTTTDATTTTTNETTTDAAPPGTTTEPVVVAAPDPTDAAPPVATDAGVTSAPAPPTAHAAPAAPHAKRHTAAAPPVSSPFPVLAFDPQAWLVAHPGTPAGDAAVAIAERYLGVPYRWGGSKPSTGFDCSGLTQYVYAQLGVWLPHYAAAQFLAYTHVDPTQLQPGDLVFFEPKPDGPGHVAIYVGGDVIVEAPHTGANVRLGSLTGAAASLGFLGAVRPSSAAPTLQLFALATVASPPGNWLARAV